MTPTLFRTFRTSLFIMFAAVLAACQSLPAPAGFTAEQKAMLQTQGFVETDMGWELTMADRVLFAVDDSNLQPEQRQQLQTLASNLLSVGITSVRVEGHTDSTGTAAHNLALSQARAESVAGPLQASGMTFQPRQIVGRGENLPLSDNSTAEGRQDNRRVVLIVEPQ